jgi:poly-beta-1,6-N-acetyl-D-glucosamine synthase
MTDAGENTVRAAVLIPAHNEEMVIAATLESVLHDYAPHDVYVFDDGSTDRTLEIVSRYLPAENVIAHQGNIGKSRGLEYALAHSIYPSGYEYVTVVDADTTLARDYRESVFEAFARDDQLICAAGQVKSRPYPASLYSVYRAYLYFLWQALFKRLQNAFNAITVAPGCASTWKTSALRRIEFDHRMSTEDFHLTIAAQRQELGRIRYVPSAVVWTQDPFTLGAFARQAMRWSRAWWEAVRRHRLGLTWVRRTADGRWRLSGLDVFSALLMVLLPLFFLRLLTLPLLFVWTVDLQLAALVPQGHQAIAVDLLAQLAVLVAGIMVAAIATGRPVMAALAPLLVALVVLEFLISMYALASVVRRKYRAPSTAREALPFVSSAWSSPERRSMPPYTGD